MKFKLWMESNLINLYQSTVDGFPRTNKRQHAIDPIHIIEVNWTPFLGVKTLFVKSIAHNEENGKNYSPMILFKGVNYHNYQNKQNYIEIKGNNGQQYFLERLNKNNDVLIRCDCNDFKWRFNFTDHTDKSLYGRVRKKYEAKTNPGSSNPLEMPGMCKHLIVLAKTIHESGFLL